jgi:hypothetical protein
MNYAETMQALQHGNATEKRMAESLAKIEREAVSAIVMSRKGRFVLAWRAIRAAHAACDRIDTNAVKLRYIGAAGSAFEFAHLRIAEASTIVGGEYLRTYGAIAPGAEEGYR